VTSPRLDRFHARLGLAPLPLDVLALSLGEWDHADDGADLARERRGLDELARLAAAVQAARDVARDGRWSGAAALRRVLLVGDAAFVGDSDDYYAPRNSFLVDVLARRRGLPIALTLVLQEVGRRAGVRVDALALPGHVVARLADDAGDAAIVCDPFNGDRVLGELDASAAPLPPRALLARMLRNLAGSYGRAGDLWRSLEVLERLALVTPGDARLDAELARLRAAVDDVN
jgi:regulator of sirC expression with transglutaminase-like and TPR domain